MFLFDRQNPLLIIDLQKKHILICKENPHGL